MNAHFLFCEETLEDEDKKQDDTGKDPVEDILPQAPPMVFREQESVHDLFEEGEADLKSKLARISKYMEFLKQREADLKAREETFLKMKELLDIRTLIVSLTHLHVSKELEFQKGK